MGKRLTYQRDLSPNLFDTCDISWAIPAQDPNRIPILLDLWGRGMQIWTIGVYDFAFYYIRCNKQDRQGLYCRIIKIPHAKLSPMQVNRVGDDDRCTPFSPTDIVCPLTNPDRHYATESDKALLLKIWATALRDEGCQHYIRILATLEMLKVFPGHRTVNNAIIYIPCHDQDYEATRHKLQRHRIDYTHTTLAPSRWQAMADTVSSPSLSNFSMSADPTMKTMKATTPKPTKKTAKNPERTVMEPAFQADPTAVEKLKKVTSKRMMKLAKQEKIKIPGAERDVSRYPGSNTAIPITVV